MPPAQRNVALPTSQTTFSCGPGGFLQFHLCFNSLFLPGIVCERNPLSQASCVSAVSSPLPFSSVALRAIVFLSNHNASPQEGQGGGRLQGGRAGEEGQSAGLSQPQEYHCEVVGAALACQPWTGRNRYQERASCQLIPRRYLNRGTFPGVKTGAVSEC